MWTESPLLRDAGAAVLTGAAAMAVLRFWEEIGNRALLDQKLCRKLVHISVGLVYILMWPLFSADDVYAPFLAALVIAFSIVKVTLIGLGVVKDDGVVNSMTRHGDYRELLKGPLYYACAITLSTVIFWKTSPISIAVICNLCAGDGVADIAGRRFGHAKLPYNRDKSYAGTIAMFIAGFIASVLYMCYFHLFGFAEESWTMVIAFGVTSLAAAVVESLPISTRLDDNLTVPLASALVGALVFYYIGARNLCCMSGDRSNISAVVQMAFFVFGHYTTCGNMFCQNIVTSSRAHTSEDMQTGSLSPLPKAKACRAPRISSPVMGSSSSFQPAAHKFAVRKFINT